MNFTKFLRQTGHYYVDDPSQRETHDRHIYVVIDDEVATMCGLKADDSVRGIASRELWTDATCPLCRERADIRPSITKRSLLMSTLNGMVDIEQMFIDAVSWNIHNPSDAPINPDPEGVMAREWFNYRATLLEIIDRMEPLMRGHEAKHGWPVEFGDAGEASDELEVKD